MPLHVKDWTVQALIDGVAIPPAHISSSASSPTTDAHYVVPPTHEHPQGVFEPGQTWLIAYRDDRKDGQGGGGTVGTVHISEGSGGGDELVGSVVFNPGDRAYPTVEGTLKTRCSTFKLTLLIRDGNAMWAEPTPCASFTLTFTTSEPHAQAAPARSPQGYQPVVTSHPSQGVPTAEKHTSPPRAQYSTHAHHEPAMVQISSTEYLEMKRQLDKHKASSDHHSSTTQHLYESFLPLPAKHAYLSSRLTSGESLSPTMRLSIGVARANAEMELRQKTQEKVQGELEGMLGALLSGGG